MKLVVNRKSGALTNISTKSGAGGCASEEMLKKAGTSRGG